MRAATHRSRSKMSDIEWKLAWLRAALECKSLTWTGLKKKRKKT